ncbi:hypothetical protein YC2023_061373 [Brassica napus]
MDMNSEIVFCPSSGTPIPVKSIAEKPSSLALAERIQPQLTIDTPMWRRGPLDPKCVCVCSCSVVGGSTDPCSANNDPLATNIFSNNYHILYDVSVLDRWLTGALTNALLPTSYFNTHVCFQYMGCVRVSAAEIKTHIVTESFRDSLASEETERQIQKNNTKWLYTDITRFAAASSMPKEVSPNPWIKALTNSAGENATSRVGLHRLSQRIG